MDQRSMCGWGQSQLRRRRVHRESDYLVNFSTACLCGLVRQRILGLRDAQDGSSGRQLPAVGRSMACWRSLDLW